MENLSYHPDSVLCDFFLFEAMKENFSGHHFASFHGVSIAVERFRSELAERLVEMSELAERYISDEVDEPV
jgi:hypothetical protein